MIRRQAASPRPAISSCRADREPHYADSLVRYRVDNFSDGFLRALRVETTDNTRLGRRKCGARRRNQMILHKGVYTACLPCAENPGRPPIWQVKAERVRSGWQREAYRAPWKGPGSSSSVTRLPPCPSSWCLITPEAKDGFLLFPNSALAKMSRLRHLGPHYIAIAPIAMRRSRQQLQRSGRASGTAEAAAAVREGTGQTFAWPVSAR